MIVYSARALGRSRAEEPRRRWLYRAWRLVVEYPQYTTNDMIITTCEMVAVVHRQPCLLHLACCSVNSRHIGSESRFLPTPCTCIHSAEDVSLRSAAPPGCRRTTGSWHWRRRNVATPPANTFESVCVQLTTPGGSFVLFTVYRPGSVKSTGAFFDELAAALEILVLQPCPIVIMNWKLEVRSEIIGTS